MSSTSSPYSVSNTFTCFASLPPELRVMIWQQLLPPPRIIYILKSEACRIPHTAELSESTIQIASLLHANQESRNETLQTYSIIWLPPLSLHAPRRHIYLDASKDTVVVDLEASDWFRSLALPCRELFSRVRRLEIIPSTAQNICDQFLTCNEVVTELIVPTTYLELPAHHRGASLSLWYFSGLTNLRIEFFRPVGLVFVGWDERWRHLVANSLELWYIDIMAAQVGFVVPAVEVGVVVGRFRRRQHAQRSWNS